jgi:hypothetical protein
MLGSDVYDLIFVVWGFLVQIVLIVHFALRKWAFQRFTFRYGWIVYALALPALIVSLVLLLGGKAVSFWLAGFLFLLWAIYGYRIDYVQKRSWRSPVDWRIGGPYVTLYLATIMFYWWPIGLISRPLWYVYGVLFLVSTWLNITSHHPPTEESEFTQEDPIPGPGFKP